MPVPVADADTASAGPWDEVGQDDEKVCTIAGESYATWRTFSECCGPWRLPQGLVQFLLQAGFGAPTPIQGSTWPPLLDGKDVIGVAKTGSGKTLGYLLPGFVKVTREVAPFSSKHRSCPCPCMLILAPTRELCCQIADESTRFGEPAGISTCEVYGGASRSVQRLKLCKKWPHCVVATPGRLLDFVADGSLQLSQVVYLVLDEADRMLDQGFEPQVRSILGFLPPTRQTCLFTATWPRVAAIARMYCTDAVHIQIGTTDAQTANGDIAHFVEKVRNDAHKVYFIEARIFVELSTSGECALIFTRTKMCAQGLFLRFAKAGAPVVCLHGDMDQTERCNALWAFRSGIARVLVATDVAQRGLDIKNLGIVINFDPPRSVEEYVHRIGRTGRAGEKGRAYTFLTDEDGPAAACIIRVINKSGKDVPEVLREIASQGPKNSHFFGGRNRWAAAWNSNES